MKYILKQAPTDLFHNKIPHLVSCDIFSCQNQGPVVVHVVGIKGDASPPQQQICFARFVASTGVAVVEYAKKKGIRN